MKKAILSAKAKIMVDILLITLLAATWISGETEIISDAYWRSFHCITGVFFFLLMILHAIQHWKFVKALTKKKVISKNKITAFTTLALVVIFLSILSLLFPANVTLLDFHHFIGELFCIIIIVHIIQKWKRFVSLFRHTKSK